MYINPSYIPKHLFSTDYSYRMKEINSSWILQPEVYTPSAVCHRRLLANRENVPSTRTTSAEFFWTSKGQRASCTMLDIEMYVQCLVAEAMESPPGAESMPNNSVVWSCAWLINVLLLRHFLEWVKDTTVFD